MVTLASHLADLRREVLLTARVADYPAVLPALQVWSDAAVAVAGRPVAPVVVSRAGGRA
jgi:hypothetical protein